MRSSKSITTTPEVSTVFVPIQYRKYRNSTVCTERVPKFEARFFCIYFCTANSETASSRSERTDILRAGGFMLQINSEVLAQMANDQIEVNEVVNLLDGMYKGMPCPDPEDRDYQLLVAANRLDKANDAEVSKFKKAIISLLQRPNDYRPQTVAFGARLIKFYYTPSYHFERVFLPELTEEQVAEMSEEECRKEIEKRNTLDEMHELSREIAEIEAQLAPKRAKLRGINEALAAMMPKSKAIHYTPVVQVV